MGVTPPPPGAAPRPPSPMGVLRTVFRGGKTIFWSRQKAISALFIAKFLFKLAILYLKFHKCQIPGPGKRQVLPISADAHAQPPLAGQK